MMIVGRLLLTLIFGAATAPAPARERKRSGSVAGYVTLQDTTLVSPAVQSWLGRMRAAGAEPLKGGGGGAVSTVGRLVIDGSGSGSGSVQQTETGTVSYGMGQGAFDVGIVLFQNRFLRVYPLAGVGGMGGGASQRSDEGARTEDSTGWGSILLRGGIGIDLMLRVWHVGAMVGLRLGYQSAAFHVQQGEGPEMGTPAGWFFRAVIGPLLVR